MRERNVGIRADDCKLDVHLNTGDGVSREYRVGILVEIFWAFLMAGVPIGIFTMAIVWWALHNGHFQESLDIKALEREIKAMSKSKKKDKKEDDAKLHPIQKKWAKFGGGFYGIVALFTYVVIEVIEIIDMISRFGGFISFIRQLDLDVIINMLVEALTNFIAAMVWPLYWMRRIDTDQTWVWFVMAYAGYWLGLKLAQALIRRRQGAET